ncbi:MAG: 4Fe-4S binding protein [Deltaproteobacteria bacterium]|nr:4Fe-4S binding protein [Deltaproteobacteria bacterium]
MAIVSTIPEKCKRCYTCVRECPANAIKVEGGQAQVIEERCIACGNCVKVCAMKAKQIEDGIGPTRALLASDQRVVACLAPSFPAAFFPVEPGKVVSAVRELGFDEVWEVAFGAELLSPQYGRQVRQSIRDRGKVIATACPAVVGYVEKYLPELVENLAELVSPMLAVARAVHFKLGPGVRVVFIGPCIAKKKEAQEPELAGEVDAVLTFHELHTMLEESGLRPADLPESWFDGPRSHLARSFPLSGGLLKTAGLQQDILDNDIVVIEGKERVLNALREARSPGCRVRFFDVLFCEGCINGPHMLNTMSVFARKNIMASYVNTQSRHTTPREMAEALAEFADVDLSRRFLCHEIQLVQPTEAEIGLALEAMKKYRPEDQLNCGACGYPTCREKAIAVCQGLAEPEMCLPYLVDELETNYRELEISHRELAEAQSQLVHTEKLASMGQLSAGVAHEINNPLGTVLLYSHILLRNLEEGDGRRKDIEMIASEATRCRDIVRGLLDFARQSKVHKTPTDLKQLVDEVVSLMALRLGNTQIALHADVQAGLEPISIDAAQVKQLLVNLVGNSIDAVGDQGEIRIEARADDDGERMEITVSDDGCGIPEKHLSRLFTPFFTTKAEGKGTGLGLAVAYGIVKMHCGDIVADSEPGHGTTFRITLPYDKEMRQVSEVESWNEAEWT